MVWLLDNCEPLVLASLQVSRLAAQQGAAECPSFHSMMGSFLWAKHRQEPKGRRQGRDMASRPLLLWDQRLSCFLRFTGRPESPRLCCGIMLQSKQRHGKWQMPCAGNREACKNETSNLQAPELSVLIKS